MKLKKTFFLSELYSPTIGGSCTMFAGRFKHYPPEKIIVLTRETTNTVPFDQQVGYPIFRIPLEWNGPKHFTWLPVVWHLVKTGLGLARANSIETIQCARPFPEGIAAYIIAKILRLPFVCNSHGDEIGIMQNYTIERNLIKTVLQGATLNLANSQATKELIKSLAGNKAKCSVVVPGFDPIGLQKTSRELVEQVKPKGKAGPIILSVGRLEQERKGHDSVIKALPQIISLYPELRYIIISSNTPRGSEQKFKLEQLARDLNVANHIIWQEDLTREMLAAYYEIADVFLMPNRTGDFGDREGFGIVFLEAGFFEKPVIGGNSGGVPDAIKDGKTGFLVNGRNPEEIAEKVFLLLSTPDLSDKMGQAGKAYALSLSHSNVFHQRYRPLLEELGL